MARLSIPYLTIRQRHGRTEHHWQPSTTLRAAGWPHRVLAADFGEACAEAEAINAEVQAWRQGAAAPPAPGAGTVARLAESWLASPGVVTLAAATRADYAKQARRIVRQWGDRPAAAVQQRQVLAFYEAEAGRGVTQAAAVIRVLRLLLDYARQRGQVRSNVARQVRIVRPAARLRVWTAAEVDAFVAAADRCGRFSIGTAILIAADTAQRESDVLKLQLQHVAGSAIQLRQSKRRKAVKVDLTPRLADRLAAHIARRPANAPDLTLLLSESTGRRYSAPDFRHKVAEVRAAATAACPSLATATFQDLRDTTVTRLAEAGCTVPEICGVTGHSERSAYDILRHYLALGEALASAAIAKLVAHERRRNAA